MLSYGTKKNGAELTVIASGIWRPYTNNNAPRFDAKHSRFVYIKSLPNFEAKSSYAYLLYLGTVCFIFFIETISKV